MPRYPITASTARTVTIDEREILAFGGCNYLGLSYRPEVQAAVVDAVSRHGLSTTASRETTGNTTVHDQLETELARFLQQEAGILTAEGYTANFAAAQGLSPEIGIAIIDARAHKSIRNAATSVGMQVFEFEHLDASSAAWLAGKYADAGVAIMTDSVFAADGAIAPLRDLLKALPANLPPARAALLVDDCHGFCVLGSGGRGGVAHASLDDPRVLITTTLAKGLGCYGGVVAGRTPLIRRIRETAPVYRSSTPIPPPLAAAARAALAIVRNDPSLVERLRRNIAAMRAVLTANDIALPPENIPIFTFTLEVERMQKVHEGLLNDGILAPLIEYPGGPSPRYFRVVVNASHTLEDIERLGATLSKWLQATAENGAAAESGTR